MLEDTFRHTVIVVAAVLWLPGGIALADEIEDKIEQGRALLHTQDHERASKLLKEAIATLQKSIEKDPGNAKAFYLLGNALFYLNHDQEAAKNYDQAISLAPKDAQYHFMRGILARFGGDIQRAEKELAKACTLAPKRPTCVYEWGATLVEMGREDKAEELFRKTLKLNPAHIEARLDLAGLMTEAGKQTEALRLYSEIIKLEPAHVDAHYNIGQIHQNMLAYEPSLRHFLKVVELEPDDWRARAKVIQNCQALGQIKQRDNQRKALFKLWKTGGVESDLYCRDQFKVDRFEVMVFEYFKLAGDEAIRYSFKVRAGKEAESGARISLGSYDTITQHARNKGLIGPNQRYFHLDRYKSDGKHETFGFFSTEPSYDDTRQLVERILKGQLEPESSMTPTKDGDSTIRIRP